uniref:Glucosamine/galactosamine-6-phosphate isomerase domain-containing protein n=1 Tax=Oncorhynchus tshawytscha TaxID=74940 RepID=A0A8C8G956_ONCTS
FPLPEPSFFSLFYSSQDLGPALAHLLFSLGLSGGSLVSMLSKELPALPDLDCSHWLVGFCDDRLVPFDDGENTYGLHKLFSKINIPDSGVLAIDPSLSVQECAEDYARKLKEVQTHTPIHILNFSADLVPCLPRCEQCEGNPCRYFV